MKWPFVMLFALAVAPLRADLTGHWRTAKPVELPALPSTGMVYCPLDANSLAAVDSFSEYRIVRDGAVEVPFRMLEERGGTETYALTGNEVSRSAPGAEPAWVTLDLGERPAAGLRLTLEVTGSDFSAYARVDGSPDGHQWQTIVDKQPVFRHPEGTEELEIALPYRRDRFVRLALSPDQGRLPRIDRVRVQNEARISRHLVPVGATVSKQEDRKQRSTVLTLDAGMRTRDILEARFDIAESAFDRTVEVAALEQGTKWDWRASGSLKRLAAGGAVAMTIDIPRTRKVQFTVSNGDDAPLTYRSVSLWRARRGLLFSADPGAKYEVWYGRADAPLPAYEMERLPLTVPPADLPQASLGPERQIPPPPPPPKPTPPWSERHPVPFWSSLAVVVGLLVLVIVRAMGGAGRPSAGATASGSREQRA